MKTIKLSWTIRIILVLVLCLIIVIAITSINKSKENEQSENGLTKLSKRLEELQKEIDDEVNKLNLTAEMKRFLERKTVLYFFIAKAMFVTIFISVSAAFYFYGFDPLTSLLSSAGAISFSCLAGGFIFINRFVEANSIIKGVQRLIRKWIYKKYKFDPLVEVQIKTQIDAKQKEYSELAKGLESQSSLSPIPL